MKLVKYQAGTEEQLLHRYEYDEDNRIVKVETSTDGIVWDNDANYNYYVHGPLARAEIGDDQLQGCDYTYTISGFLKSMNQVELRDFGVRDPGMDGTYVGQFTVGIGSGGQVIGTIDRDGDDIISGVSWNSDPVQTASDIVAAINAQYKIKPTAKPYKADNEGGTSSTVTIYSFKSGSLSFIGNTIPVNGVSNFALTGFVKDEFAMELGYYDGDFQRDSIYIGGKTGSANSDHYLYTSNLSGSDVTVAANSLYNGNISNWTTNTRAAQSGSAPIDAKKITTNLYRYDMLNRLLTSDYRPFASGNYWKAANEGAMTAGQDRRYDEAFSYDGNGNILSLRRYGNNNVGSPSDYLMDDLEYKYQLLAGEPSNRLRRAIENELDSSNLPSGIYGNDIGWQSDGTNYVYDREGKLTRDKSLGLRLWLEWTEQVTPCSV